MSSDILSIIAVLATTGLTVYLPRKFSLKQRVIAGSALFGLGLGGILLGMALGDHPILQNEAIAFTWVVTFFACFVLGAICLVTAVSDWLQSRRKRRGRRERWPS
jgi:hypothetical protein